MSSPVPEKILLKFFPRRPMTGQYWLGFGLDPPVLRARDLCIGMRPQILGPCFDCSLRRRQSAADQATAIL